MNRRAFTLIELVLATAACAVLLMAIYTVFSKAVHLRDDATTRTREARVRARAAKVLREDLRNARVSGGTLANTLQGSQTNPNGDDFPGYLTFVTTTQPDVDEVPNPDLQQVEYYIVPDSAASDQRSGVLVRVCNRNLLATAVETAPPEPLLAGVESMQVEFYDGTSWQDFWQYTTPSARSTSTTGSAAASTSTTGNTTLPQAVRVTVQPVHLAGEKTPAPALIEVLVPWRTQTAVEATATSTGATKP